MHSHLYIEINRVQCLTPLILAGKMTEFEARHTSRRHNKTTKTYAINSCR